MDTTIDLTTIETLLRQVIFLLEVLCIAVCWAGGVLTVQLYLQSKNQKDLI